MSKIEIPYKLRIESAARFYDYQVKVSELSWIDILMQVESNTMFGVPEVLVLLNPRYYSEIGAADQRGERAFPPASNSYRCRSKDVWGYDCPFENSHIHVDHMFPYSKGGSTHAQNAMHLCSEHNLSKHTDIHLIPWEFFPKNNDWIVKSLKNLINFGSRLTSEKLYFPEKQISKI